MATVVINVTNGVVQSPPRATVTRVDQQLRWQVNNPQGSGIVFENPPVVFDPNPPAGYDPWPGGAVQQTGPNQWTADVNYRVPPGNPAQNYKYDIVWTTGRLDPDVTNQPYPPDDRDEDKDKDKDKP